MAYCPAMTSPRTSLAREVAALAPAAVVLLVALHLATGHGAHHKELAAAVLVVLGTQVAPGALVWRLVRPVDGWLVEDLVMGLAVGAAMAVPSHVLGVALGQRWLDAVLPVGVGVALLAVRATRERIASRRTSPLPWAWGASVLVAFVLPFLGLREGFALPLRWQGWAALYVDAPYHQALAGEAMNRFPPHYPQVAQEPLAYHWFAHAWTAQVSTISGTPLDVLLWRFNPSVLMVAVPLVVAVAAMRISGRAWTGPVAALLAFLPDVVPWGNRSTATPLGSVMSPTQQFGVFLVVALVAVLALRWRDGEELSRASLPVLVLLLVVTGGSKGSTLPVVVAGCLLATGAVLLLARGRLQRVGLDTLLAGGVLLVLNRVMFGGGDGGVTLDLGRDYAAQAASSIIGPGAEAASAAGVTATALRVLGILLCFLAGFALIAVRETRRDPVAWLLVGGGAAGLGAMIALTHTGGAQNYFYKSAEPLIAIGAAWGATVLLTTAGPDKVRRLVGVGAAAGVATMALVQVLDDDGPPGLGTAFLLLAALLVPIAVAGVVVARATGTGRHGAVATAAVALVAASVVPGVQAVRAWEEPVEYSGIGRAPGHVHSGDVAALHWLRDHAGPDDVVMTNNHCLSRLRERCDRRRFVVAGFAERGVLVEGWSYTKKASKLYDEFGSAWFTPDQFWDPELLARNDRFITDPDAELAAEMWDLGVRWVVVWGDSPHADDLAPYATQVRRGRTLVIYEMSPPR